MAIVPFPTKQPETPQEPAVSEAMKALMAHAERLKAVQDDMTTPEGKQNQSDVIDHLRAIRQTQGIGLEEMSYSLGLPADYLEKEFDRFTATALSLLEPAIIVLMGGIVATIVLSILLPILQLNTLAGQ